VSAQVKGDPRAVDTIKELLKDANTNQLFQRAMDNPNGKMATAVLNKILPILTIGGQHISYGGVESNDSLTKILEGSKQYCPSSSP
jgi:2-methylaconitate cis-trans-isomerase PrpF